MFLDLNLLDRIGKNSILRAEPEGRVRRKAFIAFSFSTFDEEVAAIFEPCAAPPSRRIATLREVASTGPSPV